ncbi:hypothetical protein F4782DRAFT_545382 [Xylaria castorea]|nr:hypothetical protein F4782DRAFT_545382 [Xylaria castorea]
MCRYRRSIYSCNHAQLSAEPFVTCSTQQEYMSGANGKPCNVVDSHTCSTIRIRHLCQQCEDKKVTLDSRLSQAKSKMAELRQHLNETYENCMRQIDEAGLKSASEACEKSEGEEEKKAVSPVEAFLRAKKKEKHAHLMMLGTY